MIAILPAAGLGTRMAAISGGRPKELLPLGGKAILAWVIEEAIQSNFDYIVVVTSPQKPEIEEFVNSLHDPRLRVAIQAAPAGHADAVCCVPGDEPVLVLNPDTVFVPESPVPRMVAGEANIVLAVEVIPADLMSRYGIVETDRNGQIVRILEKPRPKETQSRLAIAGRFYLSSGARRFARNALVDHPGASLTTLLAEGIEQGMSGKAVRLLANERRLDCGDPEGYAAAQEVRGWPHLT